MRIQRRCFKGPPPVYAKPKAFQILLPLIREVLGPEYRVCKTGDNILWNVHVFEDFNLLLFTFFNSLSCCHYGGPCAVEGKGKQGITPFHPLEPGHNICPQKGEGPAQMEMAVHVGIRYIYEEARSTRWLYLKDVCIFPPLLPFSLNLRIHSITLKLPLQK